MTALLSKPAAPLAVGGVLELDEGQSGIFLKWGRVAGSLGPGRHVLDPEQLPFLSLLVEGQALAGEVLIANTRGATLEVPLKDEPARVIVRIADPARMFGELSGPAEPAIIEQHVVDRLKQALSAAGPARAEREAALAKAREALAPLAIEVVGLEPAAKREATQAMSALEAAEVMAASAHASPPASTPAPAPGAVLEPGARVRTSHAGVWYSGSLIANRDGQCEVEWDSGQRSQVPLVSLEPEPVYPGAHAPGTRVLAQWSDGGFYPASVQLFNGTSYRVSFENGTTSWLSPGQIKLA